MNLTLSERAATTTPMSAEQVAICDSVAHPNTHQGAIIRNLCASHEAMRADTMKWLERQSEKMSRLFEFAKKLDAAEMRAWSEELFALLRI